MPAATDAFGDAGTRSPGWTRRCVKSMPSDMRKLRKSGPSLDRIQAFLDAEPPAPAAKKPRVLTGEDEKRDSTKRSRRSGTRRSGERKPKPNPNLEPNLEPNPEPGTASKPSKAPSRRVVSVSAPPKSANPSNPEKREAKARDPAAPLTMAPAPAGSIFDVIDAARAARDTASEQKRRASERARFEAKAYRCAVFECDREPMRDFFVTRHGAAGEVRESRFCEIALGVTPRRRITSSRASARSHCAPFSHAEMAAL